MSADDYLWEMLNVESVSPMADGVAGTIHWEAEQDPGPGRGVFDDRDRVGDLGMYTTIHAAGIDGDGVDEPLGRKWEGMKTYRFNVP
jgi:hypothetical protein